MDIKDINPDNPQSFQLETVKAVTELRSDIKSLTDIVKDLKSELQRRDETYVTITAHARDIQDTYTLIGTVQADMRELKTSADIAHKDLRSSGRAKAIMWSVIATVMTLLVTYFIEGVTRR